MSSVFEQKVLLTSSWSLTEALATAGRASWQVAYLIQAWARASESSPTATITASVSSSRNTNGPTNSIPTALAISPREPRLSTGAKAGIGIGVRVGVTLLVLCFFMARRCFARLGVDSKEACSSSQTPQPSLSPSGTNRATSSFQPA